MVEFFSRQAATPFVIKINKLGAALQNLSHLQFLRDVATVNWSSCAGRNYI